MYILAVKINIAMHRIRIPTRKNIDLHHNKNPRQQAKEENLLKFIKKEHLTYQRRASSVY